MCTIFVSELCNYQLKIVFSKIFALLFCIFNMMLYYLKFLNRNVNITLHMGIYFTFINKFIKKNFLFYWNLIKLLCLRWTASSVFNVRWQFWNQHINITYFNSIWVWRPCATIAFKVFFDKRISFSLCVYVCMPISVLTDWLNVRDFVRSLIYTCSFISNI